MLSNLQNEPGAAVGNFKSIKNGWELIFKLDVDDGTNYGDNFSVGNGCLGSSSAHMLGSVEAS